MPDNVVVKNIGVMEDGIGNVHDTKTNLVIGDQGTVRVVLGGVEYVWGPNDSKTLPSNLADEAVAIDSRLRIADERDGFDRGAART